SRRGSRSAARRTGSGAARRRGCGTSGRPSSAPPRPPPSRCRRRRSPKVGAVPAGGGRWRAGARPAPPPAGASSRPGSPVRAWPPGGRGPRRCGVRRGRGGWSTSCSPRPGCGVRRGRPARRLRRARPAAAAARPGARASGCRGARAPRGRATASARPRLEWRHRESTFLHYRPWPGRGGAVTRRLPTIHGITEHDAGPYRLERLDLEFSNGERRQFERLRGRGHGAVAVVPLLDAHTVLLVREYAAGLHRYELGLVKGRVDAGETALQAADRELKEEAGHGARRLDVVRTVTLAPVYMSHETTVVLARDLYPERLPGDEPEELEVVPWPLEAIGELALREDFSEGRSIAALFAAREFLRRERNAT